MELRVQSPSGLTHLTLPESATFAHLKAALTAQLSIPASEQELCTGFPPRPIPASDAEPLALSLQSGTRLLVRRTAAPPPPRPAGRRKPTNVRRLTPPAAAASSSDPPSPSPAAAAAAASSEPPSPPPAAASSSDPPPAKKSRRVAADERSGEADPLAHTLRGKAAAPRRASSVESLARAYALGEGALGASRGGRTCDFLSEHGMIEHRVSAVAARQYVLQLDEARAGGTLHAEFKAVRRVVRESVPRLRRDELHALLACLRARGSSRRGNSFAHLLSLREMASRSAAVLWSFVHEFGGDVEGGVATLMSEMEPAT
ncbi:hypothetical protein AB1Y20_012477 [Prymnesium parvum]|uniref:ubiquitinyl hydrolase 1 n=1 Tax=Prymnesium parvum TaxID=97485 RepID=A0AB34IJJ7_PRYPA